MQAFPTAHRAWHRILPAAAILLAGASAAAAEPADPQGFLYGKVSTRSGSTYEGRLRWDDEEAFWGDHLNSSKEERPYLDEIPELERRRREPIEILGITIGHRWENVHGGRSTAVRFGDLKKIEVRRRGEAVLTLKNGSELEVEGSGDLGGDIVVWDQEIGRIEIDWRKIETIELLPTPADLEVADRRLHGTVETAVGTFQGYIQWDRDECLSSDKLDGESTDGEVAIEMGKIRTIERRGRSASRVVLTSGREMVLEGTNDVDSDNRGIFVEDERYGRVLVDWDVFERLELTDSESSGPRYEDFEPAAPLAGKVTDVDGKSYDGRIVYDLDESEAWEFLDGERDDVEYHIPFALVAAVEPQGDRSSRVILASGEELELEDSADVDEDNDGVLVLPGEGEPIYLAWKEVRRIDFER